MKKTLAILLTLIFTFSCFSVLGTTVVLAEQNTGDVLVTGDFFSLKNINDTKWGFNSNFVSNHKFFDEDGDGYKDYFRINSVDSKRPQIYSYPVDVIPGNEYELTFKLCIPEDTNEFKKIYTGNANNPAPTIVIFENTTKEDGKPNSAWSESVNDYAFSGARRSDYKSTIEIDGVGSYERSKYSIYGDSCFYNAAGSDAVLNEVFEDWREVSIKFTAIAKEEGETVQSTSIGFTYEIKEAGYSYCVKDIEFKCTKAAEQTTPDEPETPTPEEPEVSEVTDSGYVVEDGGMSTATPYDGNEFLGWYKAGATEPYSTEATIATSTVTTEKLTAKFLSHNMVSENGFESFDTGHDFKDVTWFKTKAVTWMNAKVSEEYAKSGKKSLKLLARNNKDVYFTINNLKPNTEYVVSYSWLLPLSAITATDTMNDGYYGSAIGTATTTRLDNCYAKGNYTSTLNQTFVGGQWNKAKFLFNSKENTDVRMFLYYYAGDKSKNSSIYIDELMVYEVQYEKDQTGFSSYSINVNKENSYAYASVNGAAEADSEVSVFATPYGGYKFDGWYEKGEKVSDEQIYTFTANAHRTLTAKSVKIVDSLVTITPDINKNSSTNLDDVASLARYFAGWNEDIDPAVLDIDGDGDKNLKDLVLLAQYTAGWDVEGKLKKVMTNDALPEEDLSSTGVRESVIAGQNEYFNKSTIINKGDNALLARVIKKAQRGEDITVVGLGGSITQGSGIPSPYGECVAAWLQEKFPNIKVNYVNSGIGSTTSLVGIHRLDTDVLAHNPDIVLVDFTVNDGSSDERYKLSYETIIRSLLEKEIAVISLVFGSTGDPNNPKRAENGLCFHLNTMLKYNVPVIDYYGAIWRYIDAGILSWVNDLTVDGLHPSATGHFMIGSAVNYYLNGIIENVDSINTTPAELPEEYIYGSDVYETATFLGSDKITPTEAINFTAGKVHGNKLAKGWVCDNADGGSITFEVKDVKSICIFLQNKLNVNGKGDIIINGKTVVNQTNCAGGSSGGYVWISYNEMFDEPQDLTITIKAYGKFGVGALGVCY